MIRDPDFLSIRPILGFVHGRRLDRRFDRGATRRAQWRPKETTVMDVLTDVLEAIHFKSVVHGRLELTAPWGFHLDFGQPGFYVVTRGTCWLAVDGEEEPLQ